MLNPKFERCIFDSMYNRLIAIDHIVEQRSIQMFIEKNHIS